MASLSVTVGAPAPDVDDRNVMTGSLAFAPDVICRHVYEIVPDPVAFADSVTVAPYPALDLSAVGFAVTGAPSVNVTVTGVEFWRPSFTMSWNVVVPEGAV